MRSRSAAWQLRPFRWPSDDAHGIWRIIWSSYRRWIPLISTHTISLSHVTAHDIAEVIGFQYVARGIRDWCEKEAANNGLCGHHASVTAYGAPKLPIHSPSPSPGLPALLEAGENPESLARQLGAALIKAVTANMIIVPDGPIYRLPFDALIGSDGRVLVENDPRSVSRRQPACS